MVYFGKTKHFDPNIRWFGHIRHAKHKASCYIDRAILKYGYENFEFEPIEFIDSDEEELAHLEFQFIAGLETLTPKGYNVLIYDGNFRILSKETIRKGSIARQGIKRGRNQRFVGVETYQRGIKQKKCYAVSISSDANRYRKSFPTEKDAAIAYDKMALYLYGNQAKLNFDAINYKDIDLKGFYNEFIKPKNKSSKFKNIHKSNRGWTANLHGKFLGHFDAEDSAAIYQDKIKVSLGELQDLNFPENIDLYKRGLPKILPNKKEVTSKFIGVSWKTSQKRWYASLTKNQTRLCGKNFKNEIEAAQYYDLANIFFEIKNPTFNFPELLEDYKKRDLTKIFKKKTKTSKYKFVYFTEKQKWGYSFKFNGSVYRKTSLKSEDEAYQRLLEKQRLLGIL